MTQSAEAAAADDAPMRPGMVVAGKFALLRQLGEGGVGVVFEAEDTWIGRRVAIKVLHAHLSDHADVLARFRREARAAAMTHHPNIVAVYEVGQRRNGAPYIVQELLDGETLREKMVIKQKLAPTEMIEIMVPVMGAIAAAHRAGIVHRDIKPDNIFLTRTPEGAIVPKLIDFGIAKITSSEHQTLTGALLGTPAYMSPEQVSGEVADARSDIWSLGAVMYEMLSGRCVFEAPSGAAVLAKVLTETPPPLSRRAPGLPPELVAVVHGALERDRERRFPTMAAFLDALLAYARQPDPSVTARHARSITPPPRTPLPPPAAEEEAEITTVDILPMAPTEDAGASPAAGSMRRAPAEWARPMVQPELGWYEGRAAARAPRDRRGYTAPAGESLKDNALDEAIDHAENAIVLCRASDEALGQMRLVQAIAFRWLGHYADSERCALEALETLPHGRPGWYAALGHLAIIGGYLGKNEHFSGILAELAGLEAEGPVGAPHVVTACRLAISLVRAGLAERAERTLADARARADPHIDEEPIVRAWMDVAAGELAMHAGNPTGYLQRLESSVMFFGEAGDARNACLQRANIGNAYMQLGAYARAKGLLREALAVGEPMKLAFIAPVRANLGFVMARLGDIDLGREIEEAALAQCIRESYRRFEVASRIYLAVILSLRDQLDRAEEELRAAIAGSTSAPPIRAFALANLADLLLRRKRRAEAQAAADEAMALLRALEGVEEGESLIRLVHALALEESGDLAGARAAITEARRRLLDRADRIIDPRLRRSFLDHIPENARTLAVSARYKTPPR
jgi:tetratricopeptide (TPR) repeat protein